MANSNERLCLQCNDFKAPCYLMRVPSLAGCQFWRSPHLLDVSFEGPLNCWMSVLRVPSLAGCQFLEGPLTCLDVMWSLFWSKLDLKMKIWPTSGRFGENCLLKLVLVCPILTQWWNKKKWLYFPFNIGLRIGKCAFVLSKNKDWWICNCGCAKELIMRETTTVARWE